MSLLEALTQDKVTGLIAVGGAIAGGVGGLLIGGTGPTAGALIVFGSISGLAAGAYVGDKISKYMNSGSQTSVATPDQQGQGQAVAPDGQAPAQDIGTQAMNALQGAPARLLMAGVQQQLLGGSTTTTPATGPGGVPLLRPNTNILG